jgi:hypothetical protein
MLKYPARSDRARLGQSGSQQSAMIRIDMTQRPGGAPNLTSEPPSWTILDSLSGESKATDVAVKPSRRPAARSLCLYQPLSLSVLALPFPAAMERKYLQDRGPRYRTTSCG